MDRRGVDGRGDWGEYCKSRSLKFLEYEKSSGERDRFIVALNKCAGLPHIIRFIIIEDHR